MLLHERHRSVWYSGSAGLVVSGHVSPPKLLFAVKDCAHAFAAGLLPKFAGLPGKSEYVPMSLLLVMKQSLWRPTLRAGIQVDHFFRKHGTAQLDVLQDVLRSVRGQHALDDVACDLS